MLLAFNILMSAELLIKNSEVYEEINLTRRINLRLVFAGLSLALMVASRPNFVLYIAAALPFIIKIYMHQRKTKGNFKALRNISLNFGIPLACFAIIIMYYNFARFGSPFEFGAKCQLTVSNVNYNKITDITKAINGFFSYLVQPLGFNLNFPFFHVLKVIPSSITQYMYNFPSAGIFNIPLLLILPASFFIITRMPKYDLKKQWLYVTVIVCMIMIYINATIAGVQMRYTLDIVPILTFAAVILWLEVYAWFDRRGAGKPISRVFTVVVLISSIISMLICLVGENNYIQQLNPSFYYYLSGLFEFWR
jgi:hypothetical protein